MGRYVYRLCGARGTKGGGNEDLAKSSYILVESKDMMNMNLTPSAGHHVLDQYHFDANSAGSLEDDAFSATIRAIEAPLNIRNFLGSPPLPTKPAPDSADAK